MNKIEIKNGKVDFECLFKITKIDIDRISFEKYEIKVPTTSLLDSTVSIVELDKKVGEETYLAKSEVIVKLSGRTGELIKGFKCEVIGKKPKKVMITEIREVRDCTLDKFTTEIKSLYENSNCKLFIS